METINLDYKTPQKMFFVNEDQIKVVLVAGVTTSAFTNGQTMYKIINEKYFDYWNHGEKYTYIAKDCKFLVEDYDTAKQILVKIIEDRLDAYIKRLRNKIAQIQSISYKESTKVYKFKSSII